MKNVSAHLCGAHKRVRKATHSILHRVNKDLGARIEAATNANVAPSALVDLFLLQAVAVYQYCRLEYQLQ